MSSYFLSQMHFKSLRVELFTGCCWLLMLLKVILFTILIFESFSEWGSTLAINTKITYAILRRFDRDYLCSSGSEN